MIVECRGEEGEKWRLAEYMPTQGRSAHTGVPRLTGRQSRALPKAETANDDG